MIIKSTATFNSKFKQFLRFFSFALTAALANHVNATLLDATVQYSEQISLNDGTVEEIKVVQEFHKLSIWSGADATFRTRMTLEFTPEKNSQPITVSTHLVIMALDRISGDWYIVLSGMPVKEFPDESMRKWGGSWTPLGQRVARFDGVKFDPIPWSEVPSGSLRIGNIKSLYLNSAELRKFSGELFKIGDDEIFKINKSSNFLKISRPQQTQSKD